MVDRQPDEVDARDQERIGGLQPALCQLTGDALAPALQGARGDTERLREAPAGSAWATSDGCGSTVEGHPELSTSLLIACGMGSIPEVAREFLHYLVEAPE